MFNYTEKHYYNDVSGLRYNVSLSIPPFPPDLDDPLKLDVPRMQIINSGTSEEKVIIGDKYAHRVHPLSERNSSNVYRAIRSIRDYGLSNTWDFMVTFTLSQERLDQIQVTDPRTNKIIPLSRSSYDSVMRAISKHIANLRVKYDSPAIKYLLIPELHADRYNYHFHGLMSGIPPDVLSPHWDFSLNSRGYLNWEDFEKKFGRCSLGYVHNTEAAVFYCLKYINKDLASHSLNDGKHLYYISRGLNKPTVDFRLGLPYVWFDDPVSNEKLKESGFGTFYSRQLTQEDKDTIFRSLFFSPVLENYQFESDNNNY